MHKIYKYIKFISVFAIIGLITCYGIPYIAFSIPAVQNNIRLVAQKEISNLLNTEFSIQKVNFEPFNRLALEKVLIKDQKNDTLLFAGNISATFELLPFLKNNLIFSKVNLSDFDIRAKKDNSDSAPNFQFILDALASNDTVSKPMAFELQLNSILLSNGQASWDIRDKSISPNKFDASHIKIENFNADISLNKFSADSLDAEVKKITFREHSGFGVNNVAFSLKANNKNLALRDFSIKLNQSNIAIDSLLIDYSDVKEKSEMVEKVRFILEMEKSTIQLTDFAPFLPVLRHFNKTAHISIKADGSENSINLSCLNLNYGNDLRLNINASLANVSNPDETYVYGQVDKLEIASKGINTILANFIEETSDVFETIERLGNIHFNGSISGFFSNMVAFGKLNTQIGTLSTDIMIGNDFEKNAISYKGEISTKSLMIGSVLKQGNPLDEVALSVNINGTQRKGGYSHGAIKGNISKLDFSGYRYHNITLNGKYTDKSFDGLISLEDNNARVSIEGKANLDKNNTSFDFLADISNLHPDKLQLLPKWTDSEISMKLRAKFTGREYDKTQGVISIDSLSIFNNQELFFMDKLTITAMNHQTPQVIRIESELIDAQIQGKYSFASLANEVRATIAGPLPLVGSKKKFISKSLNDFDFTIKVNETSKLSRVTNLPFLLEEPVSVEGYYRDPFNRMYIDGVFPAFSINNMHFRDGVVRASVPGDKIDIRLKAQKLNKKKKPLSITVNASVKDGEISSNIGWSNLATNTFSGNIISQVKFIQREGRFPLATTINISPSILIFNDSIWNINQTIAVIDSGKIKVDDFIINHNNQHLKIGGTLSKTDGDSLIMNLNDMSLDYIFETLSIENVQFGGYGTGKFFLTHHKSKPVIRTDSLCVKNFSYQGFVVGDLKIYSHWDNENKGVYLNGKIFQKDASPSGVEGTIFVADGGLHLDFSPDRLRCDFVSIWTDDILRNLRGRATGNISLYGPFSALNVTGDAYLEDATFSIDYLNTELSIRDSIHLREDGLFFNNIHVFDRYKNQASASGTLNYRNFRDFSYDIGLSIPQNGTFLVFNQTEKQNPDYWGTIFATGTARIFGDDKYTSIDVTARNKSNSKFFFSLGESQTAGDYKFISFNDKSIRREVNDSILHSLHALSHEIEDEQSGSHELFVNIQMEATPEVYISLIMDPSTGDMIRGTGSGNIRLEYNKTNDIKLFGNYTIEKGSYYFNFQDFITRDFSINQGSTVAFRGNPLDALLEIVAHYQVTANLTDLSEDFAQSKELSRPTVPVQCVLNIDGDLRRPNLGFDIKLPSVSQDIDRQVKSIISTEDMLNRQMVYLLALNKFYTPEYVNNGQARNNELASVASSTLSSQLNNILGQISDNWNIGTNIRSDKGDFSDVEFELALSSQLLNNRLLFNGNLGYRDDISNNTMFVGDFDLEYLLNPTGSLRLKAYNHYNDRYYSVKSSLTTQGVGVMIKKDFNSLGDLLKIVSGKRRFRKIVKKAESATEESQDESDPELDINFRDATTKQ